MHYLAIVKNLQEKLKIADPSYVPQNYEAIGSPDKLTSVSSLPMQSLNSLPMQSQKADMNPV